MRSRVSMTISSGPIRFLRSASRNSATVLASTPALRAPARRGACGGLRRLARLLLAPACLSALLRGRLALGRRARELDELRAAWSGCGSTTAARRTTCCADDLLARRLAPELAASRSPTSDRFDPPTSTCLDLRCFDAPPCLAPPPVPRRDCSRTHPLGAGLSHLELGDDGRVVGQPEPHARPARSARAPPARAAAAAPTTSRPRASRWSMACGPVGVAEAEALAQLRERPPGARRAAG